MVMLNIIKPRFILPWFSSFDHGGNTATNTLLPTLETNAQDITPAD